LIVVFSPIPLPNMACIDILGFQGEES
jgi:hypothetical protein